MQRCFNFLTAILFFSTLSYSQTIWQYDFGIATGSFNTTSSTSTFLPDPPSGSDFIRVGSDGGSVDLLNPGGTDSEVRITASSSTGDAKGIKVSVVNYTAANVFSIKFTINFPANGGEGNFYFFAGNGNYFTDTLRFAGSDLFMGMRWQKLTSTSPITIHVLSSAQPYTWFNTQNSLNETLNYSFEIIGNNSTITQNYIHGIDTVTLNPDYYSFYLNDAFIATYPKGTAPILGNGQLIDSYMFFAEGSVGNLMQMTVDDIFYSNELLAGIWPVELSSFTATNIGKNIKLNWQTSTEVNNYGFEVERCALSAEHQAWDKIGFINGNGNSNSTKNYSYEDKNLNSGKYSYRLKQIDNDGQFSYSKSIEVIVTKPVDYTLDQNYPNPFNPSTSIRYSIPEAGNVKITLFNILGQELKTIVNENKEAGVYTFNFNASNLNSGVYLYKIETNGYTQTRKMTLIK